MRRTAFTLIELLVVIAIIALLVAILLPALGRAQTAKTAQCMANLRSYGVGMSNYATDARGSMANFNWPWPSGNRSEFADLNNAADHATAHASQAVDIVRRQLSRDAIDQPIFNDRLVARNFSYLVMVDGGYFGEKLPEPAVACPEDRDNIVWQHSVDNPLQGLQQTGDPDPTSSSGFKKIMPFWSSYQMIPNGFSPESGPGLMTQGVAVTPGTHLLYQTYPSVTKFEARRMDFVAFPSQKVMLFDLFDRHHYKRPIFYAYPQAVQPLLFFDGQVTMRKTGDSNLGWNPTMPTSLSPTIYYYAPTPYEPTTLSGQPFDVVRGYYRWTRKGIRGIDYGGKEP